MRRNPQGLLRLGSSILGVLTLSPALFGQALPDSRAQAPLPTDWSHHHVIFSSPATPEQAERVQKDPRYWQQIARRLPKRLPGTETGNALTSRFQPAGRTSRENQSLTRDWSQDLGSSGTVGAGNYPAKYEFKTALVSCASDFVVYPTGVVGSGVQATIAAYNNIYSGCGGTVPTVYWAYNTQATILSSPVFSFDGKQLAFVQQDTLGHASLVLLKWASSITETVGGPRTLSPIHPASSYFACSAPCMATFLLKNGAGTTDDSDTNSSVFYNYATDTAYVGDDSGWLHQFTRVFNGVAAEVTTGGWPVQVNPTSPTPLTSPVYDPTSESVFVTDEGGFLYQVTPTAGVTISGQLDFSVEFDTGPGLVQGPVVDSTSELVYVFATSDGSEGCANGADCTAVYQLAAGFLANDTGSEALVGNSSIEPAVPSPLYVGGFDSAYADSVNATGHLYVCGNTGGAPTLYQIPIQGGVMGPPITGPALSTSASTPCSPVTDVLNPNASGGATEWLFASAGNGGISTGCSAGGCIFNFKDTPWLPTNLYVAGQEILDKSFHIEVVQIGGISGGTIPFFTGATGGTTPLDGTVTWLDQGAASAVTLGSWAATHHYAKGTEILDVNGNIELVTSRAGVSGGSIPTFSSAPGGTTSDGTGLMKITWTNVGALATAAAAESGGTSGIIIDNVVSSGTEVGASQIYFSTLGSQVCGTSGTGGCAIQASQPALH
jgi:hypothetical protein